LRISGASRRWGFLACLPPTQERPAGELRRKAGAGPAAQEHHAFAIITKSSIENAIAGVAATGGSTNAVLHLLAIAREAGLPLSIDDFDRSAPDNPSWPISNLEDVLSQQTFMKQAALRSSQSACFEAGLLQGSSSPSKDERLRRSSTR